MPEPLSEDEVEGLIRATIDELGASGMQDMGKIMGKLRPLVQGKADMGVVSAKVKALLSG